MYRRVGDRDLLSFGPVRKYLFQRVDHESHLKSYFAGDRASVNSARPTRTRFYSARSTHVGIETAMPGDCVEMNPTAALLNLSNVRWSDPFRYISNRHNLDL
jgi:hypothetical protein